MLASAGLVGLLGFVVMWVGLLIVLWRIDPRYGTLAFAVLLSRLVQAQFDLSGSPCRPRSPSSSPASASVRWISTLIEGCARRRCSPARRSGGSPDRCCHRRVAAAAALSESGSSLRGSSTSIALRGERASSTALAYDGPYSSTVRRAAATHDDTEVHGAARLPSRLAPALARDPPDDARRRGAGYGWTLLQTPVYDASASGFV